MGGRFVESVKNARWLRSPQEVGDGLESIVEFQVQINGHNQREYEDKWQGWQNWNDEKLATKLTKDDQQLVLLLPARWWPDALQEFESGGWCQRQYKRVRCRQCKCSLVENPSFESSKFREISNITRTCLEYIITLTGLECFPPKNRPCRGQLHVIPLVRKTFWRLGCGKQLKTKGKRPEGIVFTNANPRYAGKLDAPQGCDAIMLIQQVREVMTVNQEMTDKAS